MILGAALAVLLLSESPDEQRADDLARTLLPDLIDMSYLGNSQYEEAIDAWDADGCKPGTVEHPSDDPDAYEWDFGWGTYADDADGRESKDHLVDEVSRRLRERDLVVGTAEKEFTGFGRGSSIPEPRIAVVIVGIRC